MLKDDVVYNFHNGMIHYVLRDYQVNWFLRDIEVTTDLVTYGVKCPIDGRHQHVLGVGRSVEEAIEDLMSFLVDIEGEV